MNISKNLKIASTFLRGRLPGQLVIQFTDMCNATCPQCGMRTTNKYARHRLALSKVKKMIDHAARLGVQAVSLTGGEPFLHRNELLDLIRCAGDAGIPMIRTGTNGFLFSGANRPEFKDDVRRLADQLAATPLRNFWISIDSADPGTHETMRGFPGVIQGIEKALPIFHERGIYPSANLGINRNIAGQNHAEEFESTEPRNIWFYPQYRRAFSAFYQTVIDMGFTMVNTCYPMSIDERSHNEVLRPVYAATATENIVQFNRGEKALLFQALMDSIPEFRSRIRIFTPLSSLFALVAQYQRDEKTSYPCRGGIDFFFVDAQRGDTFPCGYRGKENFGKIWNWKTFPPNVNSGCDLCDWECFRDPSELMGPLLDLTRRPVDMISKLYRSPRHRKLWISDLRYYHASDYFNGRKPISYQRLSAFRENRPERRAENLSPAARELHTACASARSTKYGPAAGT